MILYYKTCLIDLECFDSIDVRNDSMLINYNEKSQSVIKMPSREQVIAHIKTIADHFRDKQEICYLVDENE